MLLIKGAKCIAKFIYFFIKLLPADGAKVLFLSRQFNQISLDYSLLIDELKRSGIPVHIVTIMCRIEKTPKGILKFCIAQIRSMYHLATARVCILDSYWPAVSILNHRAGLTVIQMWHAAGKIKKSGYQTLGLPYGRNRKVSETMDMHKNYDVVVAGGKKLNPFYCESFHTEEEKLYNVGLPRLDYLLKKQEAGKNQLYRYRPEYRGKKIILYAPTFRPHHSLDCRELIEAFPKDEYVLIVRPHQKQQLAEGISVDCCEELSSLDLLVACDYLISDYSAITVEAAAIHAKTVFYLFDYEEYIKNNGLNFDPYHEIPECVRVTAAGVADLIMSGEYPYSAMELFAETFLPDCLGHSTEKITKLILDCVLDGKAAAIKENLGSESPVAAGVS